MSEQSNTKKQIDSTSSAALEHFNNSLKKSKEIRDIVRKNLRESEERRLETYRPMANHWVKMCRTQQAIHTGQRAKQWGVLSRFSATTASSAASLGASIRTRRKDKGLTQKELAEQAGVGPRFISEVENGKDTAEIGKLLLVLDALDLELKVTRRG